MWVNQSLVPHIHSKALLGFSLISFEHDMKCTDLFDTWILCHLIPYDIGFLMAHLLICLNQSLALHIHLNTFHLAPIDSILVHVKYICYFNTWSTCHLIPKDMSFLLRCLSMCLNHSLVLHAHSIIFVAFPFHPFSFHFTMIWNITTLMSLVCVQHMISYMLIQKQQQLDHCLLSYHTLYDIRVATKVSSTLFSHLNTKYFYLFLFRVSLLHLKVYEKSKKC